MLAWIRALFNEIRPCGASERLLRSMKWASPMKCRRMIFWIGADDLSDFCIQVWNPDKEFWE